MITTTITPTIIATDTTTSLILTSTQTYLLLHDLYEHTRRAKVRSFPFQSATAIRQPVNPSICQEGTTEH